MATPPNKSDSIKDEPIQATPFRLLDLPTELRLNIYEYLCTSLATTSTKRETTFYPALLYTNKSIFLEAYPTFQQSADAIEKRVYEDEVGALSHHEFLPDVQKHVIAAEAHDTLQTRIRGWWHMVWHERLQVK